MGKFVLIARAREVVYDKIINILREKYSVEDYYLEDRSEEYCKFFTKRFKLLLQLLLIILKIKRDMNISKIIICGGVLEYLYLIVLLYYKNIEIIVFRYDIDNFRSYLNSFSIKNLISNFFLFLNRVAEKRVMMMSHKIIHKGLENELEFLPFYNKIKDKPHYLFREFITEDDILIAISGSGNSKNIIKAVDYAKEIKMIVIGLTGYDGGILKKISDYSIHVNSNSMEVCEDIHSVICHFIAVYLRESEEGH